MSRKAGEKMVADDGTFYVADTTEAEVDCDMIWIGEDTVFARIEVDDDEDADVRSKYLQPVGATVKKGAIITLKSPHKKFSAITLSSGSVNLIRIDS